MEKIADIIKYEGDNSTFIWKHPCEDFNSLLEEMLSSTTHSNIQGGVPLIPTNNERTA